MDKVLNQTDVSMNSKSGPTNGSDHPVECHLFVLVHGLWGGPNHMLTIERCIKELLNKKSDKPIVILRPSSFRFWKTYDGLKICAERVLLELFYEIETLKHKSNYQVTDLSIVGYSLGGLISRYLVGILEDIGFFQFVHPRFFSTFATPHVGIEFFKDNFFDHTANILGRYLFGKSGRQMFMADKEQILMQMADPNSRYFKGLARFEKRILSANIKNDRSVAFFTSFITEYSPFDKFDVVKVKYLKNLPKMRIGDVYVRGKFVDLVRSEFEYHSDNTETVNIQEETSVTRQNKFYKIGIVLFGTFFFLPIWVPTILTLSLVSSIYSMIKIRILTYPKFDGHWVRVKESVYGDKPVNKRDYEIGTKNRDKRKTLQKQETFKGDTSEITENAMERMLYVEDRYIGSENLTIEDDDLGDKDLKLIQHDQEEGTSTGINFKHDQPPASKDIPSLSAIKSNDSSTFNLKEDFEDDEDYISSGENLTPVKHINIMFNRKKKMFELDLKLHDQAVKTHLDQLSSTDYENYPLFIKDNKLPIKKDKQFIIENLNSLGWIKIPIFLDAWNSHDGIVARRGPRTNPKGTASIALWISIMREHFSEEIDESE